MWRGLNGVVENLHAEELLRSGEVVDCENWRRSRGTRSEFVQRLDIAKPIDHQSRGVENTEKKKKNDEIAKKTAWIG